MSNIYYKKDDPSKTVSIKDDKETFYELSNGQMIKKDIFYKYYQKMDNIPHKIQESANPIINTNDDYIDPAAFLNSSSFVNTSDIETIKNADPNKGIPDGVTNRTEVKPIPNFDDNRPVNPVQVRGPESVNMPPQQYKVYDNDDDAYQDFMKKQQPQQQPQTPIQSKINEIESLFEDEKLVYGLDTAIKNKERRLRLLNINTAPTQEQYSVQQINQATVQQPVQEHIDPSEMMFKTFKRSHELNIVLNIKQKIGKPEFIRMMMENIDGDIVGFYKKLIIKDIMDNFSFIENEVEKQIKIEIFGDDKEEEIELEETKTEEINIELIPGKKTSSGKQLYKYVDEDGKIKEMLPETADKKGLKPYKN